MQPYKQIHKYIPYALELYTSEEITKYYKVYRGIQLDFIS